jgi:hypothetical protein
LELHHPVTKAAEANVASVSAGLHLKLHMPDEALKLGRKDDMLGPPAKRCFFYIFLKI